MANLFTDPVLRHALAACLILSFSGAPLGAFLHMRRLSLLGDAMSHAILPGVAFVFMFWGMNVWAMTGAAAVVAIAVAFIGFFLTRVTHLKEDVSFTLIYMISLAIGVAMMSSAGGDDELVHILFGDAPSIDKDALYLVAGAGCVTLLALAAFYRSLVIDCFDADFLRGARGRSWVGQIFFLLLVINLVASFRVLGTLMALGLMLLPAIAARFWTRSMDGALVAGTVIALASSLLGLGFASVSTIPPGPAVVLAAGVFCFISLILGRYGSVRCNLVQGSAVSSRTL